MMTLYNFRIYTNEAYVHVSTHNDVCTQKVVKALVRYAARCARKANLLTGCYNVESGYMDVIMYSRRDRNRLKHLMAMINGKNADKVYFSSLGR